MKELTSRQQQALATKKKIMETAYDLLIDESYESLTMSKIAAKAGVAVGTLYHYYKSKEELFFTSYSGFDDLLERMQDEVVFSSPVEAIRSVIYAQTVSSFFRNPTLISSILSIQLTTHSSLFSSEDRSFPKYILKQVELAVQCGELVARDSIRQIAQTILRTARGSIFDCAVRSTPEQIAEIAIHDLDIILAHYTPDGSSSFPPVNPIWLDLNRERYTNLDKSNT